MRVAMCVGAFPVISETFILRQLTVLIDLGHEVDVFAEIRPIDSQAMHAGVNDYDLLNRATYLNLDRDASYWEQSVWPITGQTWVPSFENPVSNAWRILRAIPTVFSCLIKSPRLTLKVLDNSQYGYQATSLSAWFCRK